MTYASAYNYLISLNNLSRREYLKKAQNCSYYLKRIQALLDILGNPEKKIPHFIHVTGTSGKGSVCIMLNAILKASGKKVGLLTSPHPSIILERWEVNGKMMSQSEFVAMVEMLKPKLDYYLRTCQYDVPSFSELMTICSLYYFAQKKVEWAIMEVGCGGRYDSTNIIPNKDVAVITNVGLDHVEILGTTKEQIAYEKAGIIKKGCQVYTMDKNPKVLKIIEKECAKNKAVLRRLTYEISPSPLLCEGEGYLAAPPPQRGSQEGVSRSLINGTDFVYQGEKYSLPLIGEHQVKNAILCLEIARHLGIQNETIKKGLAQSIMPIRMEIVSKKPLIILDGAHNEDKMKSTVEATKEIKKSRFCYGAKSRIRDLGEPRSGLGKKETTHLLVGFSANKDIKTMIKLLASLKPKTVACTRFTSNIFRKTADPRLIAKLFKLYLPNVKTEVFLDPVEALAWGKKQQKTDGILLATGSIFLSGELKAIFL